MSSERALLALCASSVCALWLLQPFKPWASLQAEWKILQILWRDGLSKLLFLCDATRSLSFWERLQRVSELRSVLGLERLHQIDLSRQAAGEEGWGKTSGTHHMQHLPTLVFRGEDQTIARQALQRTTELFSDHSKALRLRQDWERTPIVKDLVLVGGGHSHVNVLRMLGMEPLPGVRVTLITRDVETPYSGMLPGHIAGQYTRSECHLDLNILARYARVRLIHASVQGLDLEEKKVLLEGRPPISYDVLSINIGSAPRVSVRHVVAVKPIDGFGRRWDELLGRLPSWRGQYRVLVVGGGAGGFELALTMHHRLQQELVALGDHATVSVGLVARSGLLPQHSSGARALAVRVLQEKNIELHAGFEISSADSGVLCCKDGRRLSYDECIWCTQGSPQSWIGSCGLQTDDDGFLLVDQKLRCTPVRGDAAGSVFAGGDIATVEGHPRPKAGVFAVMAGFVLWINIRATLLDEKLVTYWPQRSFLGLLNLGDGRCIASRGLLATQGAWLWHLKDWIDRRWMWNYFEGLPDMPADETQLAVPRATELLRHAAMRCGGCGAKVGASTLSNAMKRLDSYIPRQPKSDKAHVALGAGDDAAVVDLAGVQTVQTIDFFRSFVEDPFLFGTISAFHATSDVEAMGGRPVTALALVQIPYAMEEKQEEDLVQVMAGAATALKSLGCALAGGHTCESREMGLGFSVTGLLDGNVMTKGSMKPGDALVLTKPLGTGALFAADMRAKARGRWVGAALKSMATSNGRAAEIIHSKGAVACTDVTGFGLIGHLLEMCTQSKVKVTVHLEQVPLYEGAKDCVEMGIESSLQKANLRLRRAVKTSDAVRSHPAYPLLFDPQTSGGLLASLPKDYAEQCVKELRQANIDAALIGEVTGAQQDHEVIHVL